MRRPANLQRASQFDDDEYTQNAQHEPGVSLYARQVRGVCVAENPVGEESSKSTFFHASSLARAWYPDQGLFAFVRTGGRIAGRLE